MMKRYIFIIIGVLALFASCKKELVIDIQETRCKNFKISNASNTLTQPNCPMDITSNTFNVRFNYDGDDECLKSIHRKVTFFDSNNNKIGSLTQDPDSVSVDEPTVSVGGGSASFKFTFNMASVSDYNDIQYATVDFRTKNSNLDESNFLSLLVTMPCKTIPSPSTTKTDFVVRKTTDLCVSLRDDAAEDGDIITIIVNGNVVAQNVVIYNTPKTFKFNIDPTAQNYITFYAVNEGSSSPNTVVGSVTDGVQTHNFDQNLKQGETVSFNLIYQAL